MLIQLFGSFIESRSIILTTIGFTCIAINHFAEFYCQLFPPFTDIVTADQTAIQPGDYTRLTSTPLTWAAGARTQTETPNVVTQSDNDIEGVEYLTATISTLTGGNAANGEIDTTRNTAQVFILDLSCKHNKHFIKSGELYYWF